MHAAPADDHPETATTRTTMSSVEPLPPNSAAASGLRLVSASDARQLLARFVAGGDGAGMEGSLALPLERLAGGALEGWLLPPGAKFEEVQTAGFTARIAGDWLVCEAHRAVDDAPREAARALYGEVLEFLDQADFPHIVKCWNYLSRINDGAGDEERYKQFCLGRGEALEAGWRQDYWPSATGVGTDPGQGLRVTFLASRGRPELIENPRQVSAFRYPRQYGPKSPHFSRAALIGPERERLLFISGTAAIVGHDSLHATSVEAQVDETLRNWSSLFDAVRSRGGARPALDGDGWYRVYLRRPADLDTVRDRLEAAGLPLQRAVFLRADICRSELLFEMDGAISITD